MTTEYNSPLLSVVIPAYQCQNTIERCITSISSQSYIDLEIIVIDDGSTDATNEVCRKLKTALPNLSLYRQENMGAAHARNRGLHLAQGHFVHFMDSDDEIAESGYKPIIDIKKHSGLDCIFFNYKTSCHLTNSNGHVDLFGLSENDFQLLDLPKDLPRLICTSVTPWNKIIRRKLLLDENILFQDIHHANDRRFHFDLILRAKMIALCGSSLVYHTIGNVSSLSNQSGYKRFMSSLQSLRSIQESSSVQNEIIKRLILDRCLIDLLHEYNRISSNIERKEAYILIGELLTDPSTKNNWENQFKAEWFSFAQIASIYAQHSRTNKHYLPIVMACDDTYAHYISVAIKSIQYNLKDNIRVIIYVLNRGLQKETAKAIFACNIENICNVYLINISGLSCTLDHTNSKHYTKEIYDRLWIPFLFSAYEKVLYLDCDLIVNKSIHHIFRYNLKDKLIAGVRDLNNNRHHRYIVSTLNISPDNYINSGVILFNTWNCLQHNFREKCLKEVKRHDQLSCPDQDVINIVCAGKIRLIDSGWNYLWNYGFSIHRDPPDGTAWFMDDFVNAKEKKYIVHYASAIKPWLYPLYEDADLFWRYARMCSTYSSICRINLSRKIQELQTRLQQLNKSYEQHTALPPCRSGNAGGGVGD